MIDIPSVTPMSLDQRRNYILARLRSACPSSKLDESHAWLSIQSTFAALGLRPRTKRDQKHWADQYVFQLGIIYVYHTGAFPGFTNGDAETRFERFARAVMVDEGFEISQNLVKSAIRRLNARRNSRFLACVEESNRDRVAA
jgi:hypothetical protein